MIDKVPRPTSHRFQLSPFQESALFLRLLDPLTGSFNVARTWLLRGSIETVDLQEALNRVAARHNILRSKVVSDDGHYMVVVPERRLVLHVTALSGRDDATARVQASRILEDEFARPFDFESDTLVRVHLVRLSVEVSILMVVKPHLITDDSSMSIFLAELAFLYSAIRTGRDSSLQAPLQFVSHAERQWTFCRSSAAKEHLERWSELLSGAPASIGLPKCDSVGGSEMSRYAGGEAKFALSEGLLDRLNEMRRDEHVTLYVVLLAAFAVLLRSICPQDDIVVGGLVNNRVNPSTRRIIGPLVNTFALRFRFDEIGTFRDALRAARHLITTAYRCSELPFEQIIRYLKTTRRLDPRFRLNAVFDYFASKPTEPDFYGVQATRFHIRRKRAQVGLTLKVWPDANGMRVFFEYQHAHFGPEDIDRIYALYVTILDEMARSSRTELRSTKIFERLSSPA